MNELGPTKLTLPSVPLRPKIPALWMSAPKMIAEFWTGHVPSESVRDGENGQANKHREHNKYQLSTTLSSNELDPPTSSLNARQNGIFMWGKSRCLWAVRSKAEQMRQLDTWQRLLITRRSDSRSHASRWAYTSLRADSFTQGVKSKSCIKENPHLSNR